nr:MAG TPA: hypothetical protein [Bacteriophage sp.]
MKQKKWPQRLKLNTKKSSREPWVSSNGYPWFDGCNFFFSWKT